MQITDPNSFFRGWYDIKIPAGRAQFKNGFVSHPKLESHIEQWLLENVGIPSRATWAEGDVDKLGRHILFRNKDKALLFKLTWV